MNWEAIAAIDEILSATAVLVSLIFVAVQINKNTRANQTAGYRALIDALGQLGLTIATVFPIVQNAYSIDEMRDR